MPTPGRGHYSEALPYTSKGSPEKCSVPWTADLKTTIALVSKDGLGIVT
jgi:hypothetical protein